MLPKENYVVIDGVKTELTEEMVKKLLKEYPTAGYFERKRGESYYAISDGCIVARHDDIGDLVSTKRYDAGNYCRDEALMKRRAADEQLSRLLWRFANTKNDENGTKWWTIVAPERPGRMTISTIKRVRNKKLYPGMVFFTSKELAQEAVNIAAEHYKENALYYGE